VYSSLGIVASISMAGCGSSLPRDTQVYEVNGAKVCDDTRATPDRRDDCDSSTGASGYYYSRGSGTVFYRSGSGERIVVDRNSPGSKTLKPGSTVPLNTPVLTNESGVPLMNGDSAVTRSTTKTGPITTTPVRSTASFDHPTLGYVNAGRTTSTNRGMSFGRSSSGFGSRGFSG
jgi:hypothetical protein